MTTCQRCGAARPFWCSVCTPVVSPYCPTQEELDRFLKGPTAAAAAGSGGDFEHHKLDKSNLGFQMLKQAGWEEGKGLGQAGIANPVNMA